MYDGFGNPRGRLDIAANDSNRKPPAKRAVSDEQRRAAASYVATLAQDLRALAQTNGLPTLAYLLDMARLEAESAACAPAEPGSAPEV